MNWTWTWIELEIDWIEKECVENWYGKNCMIQTIGWIVSWMLFECGFEFGCMNIYYSFCMLKMGNENGEWKWMELK